VATIIKANYGSSEQNGRQKALTAINYYVHRHNADGQYVNRTGFSRDHDDLDLQTMKDLIGGSNGGYYYRMILSPGALQDTDVNLKDWTRDLMLELEGKHGEFPYVAIEHRDQTDHAHVHLVMVLDQKLSRAELDQLRDTGTSLYESRRDWYEPSYSREADKQVSREPIAHSEAFIAGYSDEPDDQVHRLRKNRSQSLDR
jgi:hypothetical protein